MKRFYELLEKRKSSGIDFLEEEELIELSKNIPSEELEKIDKSLLTYTHSSRIKELKYMIDELKDLLQK